MNKLSVSMTQKEQQFGWFYWAFQLLVLPALLQAAPDSFSDVQLNFLYFLLNFLCLAIIFHTFLKRSCQDAMKRPVKILFCALLGFLAYWAMSLLLQQLIFWVKPDFSNANDSSILQLADEDFALTLVGTVALVPLAEELLYRGLFFGCLYRHSPAAAYVVSTAVFAAIHVFGYLNTADPITLGLCFLQYLPAGVCLGWAYCRSGSIFAPIAMHVAINLTSLFAMR